MHRDRHEIRGPTGPDKANDRAGNAAVHETDWSGSGTNQPSRVSRYVVLAPAASVGGRADDVKVSIREGARIAMDGHPPPFPAVADHRGCIDQSDGQEIGVAGKRAGLSLSAIVASIQYRESGTNSDER